MNRDLEFNFQPSFDLAMHGKDLSGDPEVSLILKICRDLYMLDRTLVSDDYDKALEYLGNIMPMTVHGAPSGSRLWTWTVPEKWSVKEAFIEKNGERIADFHRHPLYLASYSTPFSGRLSLEELKPHIVTNPDRPAAIPYHYHYYKRDWSFCLPFNMFKAMEEGEYNVVVDTALSPGELKAGEWTVPGRSGDCILFSAHLCHPGQVNDGLAGAALGLALMQWLASTGPRHYTYRLIAHPENIGSLCYLYKNQDIIKNFKGAVFLEMLGNKNHLKIQRSRQGDSFTDRLMELAVQEQGKPYGVGPFRKVICNDEININGPGINIPCVSLTRWPYPEYHTSDDNPDILSMEKLREALDVCKRFVDLMENNWRPVRKYTGNLFLSRYGLYEDLNVDDAIEQILLSFEGEKTVWDISRDLGMPFDRAAEYVRRFHEQGLVELRREEDQPFGRGCSRESQKLDWEGVFHARNAQDGDNDG